MYGEVTAMNNSIRLFGLEVHWYGILIACGMALAVLLRKRRLMD